MNQEMSSSDQILRRNLVKIKQQLEAKEYYEASQLYLSVANRQFKKNPDEGVQLFFEGCNALAKEGQYECVLDLSKKLVQNISGQRNIPESHKGMLAVLYSLLPGDSPLREEYQRHCISCFSSTEKHKDLCDDLQYFFGACDYKDMDYKSAEKNLVMSGSKGGILIGNICKSINALNTPVAVETSSLMLIHAVVSAIGANNALAAFEGNPKNIQKYWESGGHHFKKAKKYDNKVLNLAQIIFLTILSHKDMLYKYILQHYSDVLGGIDSKLPEMCSAIQVLYFQTAAPPLMSLLENFGGFI